jgi:hypothetical protein
VGERRELGAISLDFLARGGSGFVIMARDRAPGGWEDVLIWPRCAPVAATSGTQGRRLRFDQFLPRRLELFGRHWGDDRGLIVDLQNGQIRCHFRPIAEPREGLVRYIDEHWERHRRALFRENFLGQLECSKGDASKARFDRLLKGE